LALQTKRFGEMMRHVLPKMPQESAELPQFFETVKKLYAMYEVPAEVQAKILIPLLTAQAKSLVNQMTIDDMSRYFELKEFLLAEYKLSPREYKIRFETAVKSVGETYTLFAAKLHNLLSYYLKSRLVEDYETLIELLISDRLKGSLPQELLNYVLTQEGEGWYVASKVASLADVYVNNKATVIGQKAPEGKSAKVATAATSEEQRLARAPEAVEEDITRPVKVDLEDLSRRPRRRRSSAIAVVSLGTFLQTAIKTEKTSMTNRRHSSRTSRYGVMHAVGMAILPETAPTSRATVVVDTEAVFTEDAKAIIKRVKDVAHRTKNSASTWCQQAVRRR